MDYTLLLWIVACILFTLVEALTQQFVSIWFVAGSICALLLSIFNVDLHIQCIVFVVVSAITLVLLRPYLKKLMMGKIVPTNSDQNIGQLAIVTKSFDEESFEGRIMVNNMDWAALSLDGIAFKKGDKVIVDHIEGVKCHVLRA